jgi:type IV pilus assembly protein PilB
VRLICQKCKTPVADDKRKDIIAQMQNGGKIKIDTLIYEGKGCQECRFTGYKGRTAIHEILPMSEKIREMVLKRQSSQQIKQQAISEDMVTLRNDGILKVLQGITTYSEVLRVAQQEELPI